MAEPAAASPSVLGADGATPVASLVAPPATHTDFQTMVYSYMTGYMTSNMIALGDRRASMLAAAQAPCKRTAAIIVTSRLGLYKCLTETGPVSAADLARRLQLVPRYVHEWCRQQASARLICCDAAAETFWMTPVQQDILSSSKEHGQGASPHFAAGGFQSLAAFAQVAAEDLPELFRTGGGLTYDSYDQSVTCGVCRELGVWVRHALLDRLCSLPGARPLLEGGCRVADVGCGCGEAALAVAAAFPRTTVRGFDTSAKALAVARAAAAARGVRNAEFFDPGEEERGMGEGVFDLVMTHDAIHDCARPAAVLASVRRAMKPGARWVLGDMGALESHAANVASHPLAPLLYGFSCHLCLPSAMVGENPAGLGTLGLSQPLVERMLREAGFSRVEVLDWGHPLNRYYLVTA